MKRTVEIIDKEIAISDKEIALSMDFDAVLDQVRTKEMDKRLAGKLTKRFLAILGICVLLGVTERYFHDSIWGTDQGTAPEKLDQPATGAGGGDDLNEVNPVNDIPQKEILPQSVDSIYTPEHERQKISNGTVQKEETKAGSNPTRPKEETKNRVPTTYEYVDAEPEAGIAALYQYFETNLKYPEEALADSIEGDVIIRFTISKNGDIKNVVVEKSLGQLFDIEAVRLIDKMPAWVPASVNGEPVDSRISVPLHFRIEK